MYLTRAQVIRSIPISRKGTKYLARASSHVKNAVPVVVAIRDMLNLAKTSKEVKEMIKQKSIKINGKVVKDHRESIKLFSILDADKKYKLSILPTGRFFFEEIKDNSRICKIIGKTKLRGDQMQLNLHDGTNILTKNKARVGDSVELDSSLKVKRFISFEKGEKVFVISGKSVGKE